MSDYQLSPNKKKTLFYITYRTKNPEGGYKKNYLHNKDGSIVSFDDEAKANKYRTSLRAKEDAKNDLKVLRAKMNQKYGNHSDYLDSYLKQKKKDAPKSWERSEFNMVHYVFTFFASTYLKNIYTDIESKGYKWKSFHCLRHTRATEIISQTHDQTLLKLILGHKSRVFERYVHLEATLAKKLTREQESIFLDFNLDGDEAI